MNDTTKHILILSMFLLGLIAAILCGNTLAIAAMREGIFKDTAMGFFPAIGLYLGTVAGGMMLGIGMMKL